MAEVRKSGEFEGRDVLSFSNLNSEEFVSVTGKDDNPDVVDKFEDDDPVGTSFKINEAIKETGKVLDIGEKITPSSSSSSTTTSTSTNQGVARQVADNLGVSLAAALGIITLLTAALYHVVKRWF